MNSGEIKKSYNFDFVIIGGDKRQVYLAEILAGKGYKVITYAADSEDLPKGCNRAESLREAVAASDTVITPIPMLTGGEILHNFPPNAGEGEFPKTKHQDLSLNNLKNYLEEGQILFGGCMPGEMVSFCEEKGIGHFDFMKEEPITIFNSIATAEGIIAEAIMKSPFNLHHSSSLILGYGACGKTLADKLKGMSVKTTVCARKDSLKALADANGHRVVSLENLVNSIGDYDFIFNTIPAVILDDRLLKEVKPAAMIFDIASAPGGVDYNRAKELGIKANSYPGLPGKYSPGSSATVLADYIIIHKNKGKK